MTFDQILAELKYNNGTFPRSALKHAIEEQGAITPKLLEVLEEAKNNLEKISDESNYMLHIYAMFLLAQFRETKAYPLIIEFFSVPGELPLELTGDIVTEHLGRILASVYDGNIELLKTLVEDRKANQYVRTAGIQAFLIMWGQNILSREAVIAYYKALFSTKLEREESYLWTSLVLNSARLCPVELKEQIDDVYQKGWVEEFFIRSEDVEELIEIGPERALEDIRNNKRYGLIHDTISEMKYWACFNQERRKRSRIIPANEYAPKPKIGRNEPCPCGSGKKYKKCCLLK